MQTLQFSSVVQSLRNSSGIPCESAKHPQGIYQESLSDPHPAFQHFQQPVLQATGPLRNLLGSLYESLRNPSGILLRNLSRMSFQYLRNPLVLLWDMLRNKQHANPFISVVQSLRNSLAIPCECPKNRQGIYQDSLSDLHPETSPTGNRSRIPIPTPGGSLEIPWGILGGSLEAPWRFLWVPGSSLEIPVASLEVP